MQHRQTHSMRRNSQDAATASRTPDTAQTRAPAYRLAYMDPELMAREELRPVRLQLELLKPQLLMDEAGIVSTVVVMGSARICDPGAPTATVIETGEGPKPASRAQACEELGHWYEEARRFARSVTELSLRLGGDEAVVVTGGGPGIMEAGNRGAADVGGRSIGLNIVLPHEQAPNAWITPELCFNFHYFAIRKMHFLLRAKAVAIFPGGFGTLDELFETLMLIQTGRMDRMPILLFDSGFWKRVVNWQALVEARTISPGDLDLIRFVDSAEDAMPFVTAAFPGP